MTSQADHLNQLAELGGRVSHDSAFESGLSYSVQTYADGTRTARSPSIWTDGFLVRLDGVSLELAGVSPEAAEHVALQILATVKASARAGGSAV